MSRHGIQNSPALTGGSQGSLLQIRVGKNRRGLGYENRLDKLGNALVSALGRRLHHRLKMIGKSYAHSRHFCKSCPGVNRAIPKPGTLEKCLTLWVMRACTSAVMASSIRVSSSGSEETGRSDLTWACRVEAATKSSRNFAISSARNRTGTNSRSRTSSYSRTTAVERWRRNEGSAARIFWSRQKEAPREDLNPLTMTLASKTTSIVCLICSRGSAIYLPIQVLQSSVPSPKISLIFILILILAPPARPPPTAYRFRSPSPSRSRTPSRLRRAHLHVHEMFPPTPTPMPMPKLSFHRPLLTAHQRLSPQSFARKPFPSSKKSLRDFLMPLKPQHNSHRLGQNDQVQQDRPVFDVV